MTEKLLKEISGKLQAIENLLILQLIQTGATESQIGEVLNVKSVQATNLRKAFSIKKERCQK